MKRRDLLQRSAAFGFMAALPFSVHGKNPDFGSMDHQMIFPQASRLSFRTR